MLLYAVVILAVAVALLGSYRALSGGEALGEDDYRMLLRRLVGATAERGTDLRDALTEPGADEPGADEPGVDDPLVDVATATRKRLSSYQQQLSQFETGVHEGLDAHRSLLSMAIEDLGWACRMIEAGMYPDNPGIAAAVRELRQHSEECLGAVELLGRGETTATAS